jgi:hypothetical protein
MKFKLVFALFSLWFLGSPVYAQSPCSECLKAVEENLKKCLDNAISAGDKISCDDSRQARMKACVSRACKIERDEREKRDTTNEQQAQNKPGITPYTPTKIEWLALTVNAQLQYERHAEDLYEVFVIQADHETLEILIRDHLGQSSRHRGTTKLEIMKSQIKTTRDLIMATAKRYGWENWVRIREPVEVSPR